MKRILYICAFALVMTLGSVLKSSAQTVYYDYLVPNVPEIYFENPDQPLPKFEADSVKKQAANLKNSDKKMAVVDKKKDRKEKRKVEAKKEE